MSLYFDIGNKLSSSIADLLFEIDPQVGFVAGGGYGYDSVKYKDSDLIGDFDFLCLADNEEKLQKIILKSDKYLSEIGFSGIKIPSTKDLQLFNDEVISFLGISGKIENTKASINISTKERFADLVKTNKLFYKARSDKRFSLFIAKGSNGEDLVVCRLSPEISKLYDDNKEHYLLPNRMFFSNGDFIHLGIYSDLLAKGKVLLDDSNQTIIKLQKQIWGIMATHASSNIFVAKEWHKMFASCQFFSQDFVGKINKSINLLNIDKSTATKSEHDDKSLLVVFAERKYYKDNLLSDKAKSFIFDDETVFDNTLADYLAIGNEGLNYLDAIHIVNSETIKLTDLISKLGLKKRRINAPDINSKNTLADLKGKFSYKNKSLSMKDVCSELQHIVDQEADKFELGDNDLYNFVTTLRKEVTNYICEEN